jgi:hypothetical protein
MSTSRVWLAVADSLELLVLESDRRATGTASLGWQHTDGLTVRTIRGPKMTDYDALMDEWPDPEN